MTVRKLLKFKKVRTGVPELNLIFDLYEFYNKFNYYYFGYTVVDSDLLNAYKLYKEGVEHPITVRSHAGMYAVIRNNRIQR